VGAIFAGWRRWQLRRWRRRGRWEGELRGRRPREAALGGRRREHVDVGALEGATVVDREVDRGVRRQALAHVAKPLRVARRTVGGLVGGLDRARARARVTLRESRPTFRTSSFCILSDPLFSDTLGGQNIVEMTAERFSSASSASRRAVRASAARRAVRASASTHVSATSRVAS
jgi:hypothetical protein